MPTQRSLRNKLHLKCESASRCFQSGEGPSRGLLRDCEIFANLRLKLYKVGRGSARGHLPGQAEAAGAGLLPPRPPPAAAQHPVRLAAQRPGALGQDCVPSLLPQLPPPLLDNPRQHLRAHRGGPHASESEIIVT